MIEGPPNHSRKVILDGFEAMVSMYPCLLLATIIHKISRTIRLDVVLWCVSYGCSQIGGCCTHCDDALVLGRIIIMRHIDVENQSVLIRKTGNDSAFQPPDTQHLAPIPPVDTDRRPPIWTHVAKFHARVLVDVAASDLRRVELRILEAVPR